MSRISRNEDAPQALVVDGASEMQKARNHYDLNEDERNPRYLPSSFFKAYKADGVKPALNNLFHKKCAYCETKAQPSGYFAIEWPNSGPLLSCWPESIVPPIRHGNLPVPTCT